MKYRTIVACVAISFKDTGSGSHLAQNGPVTKLHIPDLFANVYGLRLSVIDRNSTTPNASRITSKLSRGPQG